MANVLAASSATPLDQVDLSELSVPAESQPTAIPLDQLDLSQLSLPEQPAIPLSAVAPEEIQTEEQYLIKLTPGQLAQREAQAMMQGTRDPQSLMKFEDAAVARRKERKILYDDRRTGEEKAADGAPDPYGWGAVEAPNFPGAAAGLKVMQVGQGMAEGMFSYLNEIGKLVTRKDLMASRLRTDAEKQPNVAAPLVAPDIAADETPGANLTAANKVNLARGAGMLQSFVTNVANFVWRDGSEEQQFREQHRAAVTWRLAEEEARRGKSIFGPEYDVKTDVDTVTAIEAAPIADPSILIPFGVGLTGARTTSLAAATLERAVAPSVAAQALAKTSETAANALRATQTAIDGSPLLHGLTAAAATSVVGGDAAQAAMAGLLGANIKPLGIAKKTLGGAASSFEKTSQQLLGKIPPGPIGRFSASAYRAVAPEAKLLALGQLYNTPFLLGADTEEEFSEMLTAGVVMSAAGSAAGHTLNGLSISKNYFAPGDRSPEIRLQVKDTGIDPVLDASHQKVVSKLNNASNNFVQAVRDFTKKDGGELYTLDVQDYGSYLDSLVGQQMINAGRPVLITPEFVELTKRQQGVTLQLLGQDGKPRKVALSRVSDTLPGLSVGHEAGHLLENALSPEEIGHIYKKTRDYYGDEQLVQYHLRYEDLVNPERDRTNDPKTWSDMDPTQQRSVLSEIFAEHASAAFNSIPIGKFGLENGSKNYAREVYGMLGRGLEKLGVKQPELSPEGFDPTKTQTGTGIEPSVRLSTLIENVIQAKRLDGELPKTVPSQPAPPVIRTPDVEMTQGMRPGTFSEPANARPLAPKPIKPGFKKGDPVGDLKNDSGVLVGEDAKVVSKNDDGSYDVEYTHPDTGERLVGAVPESALESPNNATPGTKPTPAPKPVFPVSPITSESPVGVPAQPVLPAPRTVENTTRPELDSSANAPAKTPNVRTTDAKQQALAGPASPEVIQQNLATLKAQDSKPRSERQAVETDYYSAKSPVAHPDQMVREKQRLAADAAEQDGQPNPLRTRYQKIFVPYKLRENSNGSVTTFGMSLDKVAQNLDLFRGWLSLNPEAATPALTKYLSDPAIAGDLQTYLTNQSNGYAGDGRRLRRPVDARDITPETPGFTPTPLDADKAQVLNLLMGMEQPGKQTAGQDFARRFAELNGVKVGSVQGVSETNSLRQTLRDYGFDPRILNAVVENLRVDRMTTPLKVRSDLNFPAGDTGFQRAGFMPSSQLRSETSGETVAADVGRRIRSFYENFTHPDAGADGAAAGVARSGAGEDSLAGRPKLSSRGEAVASTELSGDGRGFAGFFTSVTAGVNGKQGTGRAYSRVIPLAPEVDSFASTRQKYRGNFDNHIATSIPGFDEVQSIVGHALTQALPEGASVLDIGASEGALMKAVTETSGGAIQTVALDPNFAMAEHFAKAPVEGSRYVTEAFGSADEAGKLAWTEDDGKPVRFFDPKGQKFDAVHEAMVFQFISNARNAQIGRMKELLKPDGIVIVEEKVANRGDVYRLNEAKKDAYKAQYYTDAEMAKKRAEVLDRGGDKVEGMSALQVAAWELEQSLSNHFDHVVQFWDSGNFKGYVAGNDAGTVDRFVSNLQDTSTEYSTVATPRDVRGSRIEDARFMPAGKIDSPEFKKWFGDWEDPAAWTSKQKGPVSTVVDYPLTERTKDAKAQAIFGLPFNRLFPGQQKDVLAQIPPAKVSRATPKVVYHSTRNDFSTFEAGRPSFDNYGFFGNIETRRHAIFFSDSVGQAESYSSDGDGNPDTGGRTLPVYLDIKSPLYLDSNTNLETLAEETNTNYRWLDRHRPNWWGMLDGEEGKQFVEDLKAAGYDGVVFEEDALYAGVKAGTTYAVFDPTQIKSAIGNTGAFDPKNPDIRYMPQPGGFAEEKSAPTGWVLPGGEYIGKKDTSGKWRNDGDFHLGVLAERSGEFDKRFGLKALDPDARLSALKKGFVRVRYDGKTGRMGVEALAPLKGRELERVKQVVEDNVELIDRLDLNLFDADGRVATTRSVTLFDKDGIERSEAALGILKDGRREGGIRDIPGAFEPSYMPALPIDTPEFKKWFGKSKVATADGEPQVVFHGTDKSFNKFSRRKATQQIFWFTSDKSAIEAGEVGAQGKGKVMELYASLQNPAGWEAYGKFGLGELEARGYDGAILPDDDGSFVGFAFESAQLKSATKNVGTFDGTNPDIRYMPQFATDKATRTQFQDTFAKVKANDGDGATFDQKGGPADLKDTPVIVTLGSLTQTADTASPQKASNFFNRHEEFLATPNARPGIFRFGEKVSADLNVALPTDRLELAKKFATDNNQDSIYDAGKGEVIKTGGDGIPLLNTPLEYAVAARQLTEGTYKSIAEVKKIAAGLEGTSVSTIPNIDLTAKRKKAVAEAVAENDGKPLSQIRINRITRSLEAATAERTIDVPVITLDPPADVQRIVVDPQTPEKWDQVNKRVDAALKVTSIDPELGLGEFGYRRAFAETGLKTDIPPAPEQFAKYVKEPALFAKMLTEAQEKHPDLVQSALEGLDHVAKMHKLAREGRLEPETVALHMAWGIASRMLAPFDQEGGWIRLIRSPEAVNYLMDSVDGTFSATLDQWTATVQKAMKDSNLLTDDPKAMTVGKNATSNLNDFYLMLSKWNGRWQSLTSIFNNPELTGPQMRDEFFKRGFGGAGIKHKVVSFDILTLARDDVFIGDRWQVVHANLPLLERIAKDRGLDSPFDYDKNGTPQDRVGIYGAYGPLLDTPSVAQAYYKLVERGMEKIGQAPEVVKVFGKPLPTSAVHWLSWNIIKNEPVGHSSLEVTHDLLASGTTLGKVGRQALANELATRPIRTQRFNPATKGFDEFTVEKNRAVLKRAQ